VGVRDLILGQQLAAVEWGYLLFPPLVVAGIAVGFVVRRWIVLLAPVAFWLVSGLLFGVVPAIRDGRGEPLAILGLWAVYGPLQLTLTLAAGVALGRVRNR
jgi:hypothetical protein